MLHRHELPSREPGRCLVPSPGPREHALDPVGADELDLDVSSAIVIDPHLHRHVLESLKVCVLERVRGDGVL